MAAEQTCPQCGTSFVPTRSHAPVIYCGYRCSALARNEKHRGGPIPTKTCERCGVAFEKNPDWNLAHWKQRRFCSSKCRGNGKIGNTVKTCDYCGEAFEPSATGRSLTARYCRDTCYFMSLRTERYPVNRKARHLAKQEFSHRQKRQLLERADYRCQRCRATENLECDHIIPIWNDGENAITNGQVLCQPCHREKTTFDIATYWQRDMQKSPANQPFCP